MIHGFSSICMTIKKTHFIILFKSIQRDLEVAIRVSQRDAHTLVDIYLHFI
jgi:hypothetical protein